MRLAPQALKREVILRDSTARVEFVPLPNGSPISESRGHGEDGFFLSRQACR